MRLLALFAVLTFGALAAEESGHGGGEGHANTTLWKVVNFAILAGGLGYLIAKNVPALFRARTEEIQKGIGEAARLRDEAEAKAADIERRMANLGPEIEQLKKSAADEFGRESERIKAESAQQIARVQDQAQQEIASAAKSARQELKAFSADLAIQLATEKIRYQMSPEAQDAMLDGFVNDIGKRNRTEVH